MAQAGVGAGETAPDGLGPQDIIRPTVATIDLGAVQRNARRMRAAIGPGVRIWGVIKADAYGHGAIPIANALERECEGLAVSLVEEGVELRAANVRKPILVLGGYYGDRHADFVAMALTPVVTDIADLDRFADVGEQRRSRVDVHVKVDTGMNRLGVAVAEFPEALARIRARPSLRLAGICTHFASADAEDPSTTEAALHQFIACTGEVRGPDFSGLQRHASNSAAAVRFPAARLEAVRPGLALYGAMPSDSVRLDGLEPALTLTTKVLAQHHVPRGGAVSYGGLWRAARPSRVGTLPVGYADGYPKHVQAAAVLVGGRRAPVIGAVCMDMLMVDLTDVQSGVGDEVTLLGRDGDEVISVDDLARWSGTINYEILCGISKRVPRRYIEAR